MFIKDELYDAVKMLGLVVPARSSMPILQTIRFAPSEDGQVKLAATNLESSLTIAVSCNAPTEGFCVPARKFTQLLGLLDNPEVRITKAKSKVEVSKGKGQATFSVLEVDEFPVIDIEPDSPLDIDTDILISSLKSCLVAVSDNESHPILTGVLLKSHDNVLSIAAADGFRLSLVKLTMGLPNFEVVIPGTAAKFIVNIFKDEPTMNIALGKNEVIVWNSKVRFQTQLIAGSYPDVERIIPSQYDTTVTCDRAELLRKVKQSMVFAKEVANIVTFAITDTEFKIVSNDGPDGDRGFVESFEKTGPDIEIAMNGKYMLDAAGLADDKLIFKFTSPTQPIGIYLPSREDFVHVVMPMHLGRR